MPQNCSKKKERFIFSAVGEFMLAISGICVVVLFVVFLGGSFRGGMRNLKVIVADVPSSYNSTKFINNNFGMMAATGQINSYDSDSIKIISPTFYNSMAIILKEMHGFIVKMNNTALREKAEEQKIQSQEEMVQSVVTHTKAKGLVVIPSKDKQMDADAIEQIKNSFSDNVKITPDESGESGIIQPIFRDKEGNEYIYVLVPIQEDEK